ncbi:MAG: pilus (MSHA type) biogenesis protein MshL [Gammaproteobacteria bacterium]|nr:pilus (MSHA type) biogenesis protein MshL [Gammaproteobacteria bacterium]
MATILLIGGCTTQKAISDENMASIIDALEESKNSSTIPAPPPEVSNTLLPKVDTDVLESIPEVEQRFDISVKSMDASQFFMGLVKGTDKNMVVHPDVTGDISLTLADVTLNEVLNTIQDVFGYRYRRQGNTYQVFPAKMRTQVFSINYLDVVRNGNSRTSINSGESGDLGTSNSSASSDDANNSSQQKSVGSSGSEVRTDSQSDFWQNLSDSLSLIIGEENGRKVVVHAHSGVIVVHAMPEELLDVQNYLNTIENVAHRLVVLEAKVIEVTLNDNFQTGINWSSLVDLGNDESVQFSHSGSNVTANASTLGGIFAANANLQDFSALLEMFKTQGDVQVLSSPRISTVNNQKAVIKVGQDEYFVTDFDTETAIEDGVGSQNIDVSLTPFFSGVALDVLPQIDGDDNVILHIHPAISEVMEEEKNIKISTNADLSIPLALSTIRESDSIVRARSGQVVVVGGLMKNAMRVEESRTPALGDIPILGELFRNRREIETKSELVILLRPIVIHTNEQWKGQLNNSTERFDDIRTSKTSRSTTEDEQESLEQ